MRVFHSQWKLLFVFMIGLAAVMAYNIHDSFRVKVAEERRHLSNLATISADIIERRLLSSDQLLQVAIESMPAWQAAADDWRTAKEEMRQLAALGQGTEMLVLLSPSGEILADSRDDMTGQSFAHRHYFRAAKEAPSSQTRIISPPFVSVFGNYTLSISRKFDDAKGAFAGVVMATMDMAFIGQLLGRTRYANDMETALIHGDGLLIMVVPERVEENGRNLAVPGSFFTRHRQGGEVDSYFAGREVGSGRERMMVLRTIQPAGLGMDNPLVVAIGRDTRVAFADLRQRILVMVMLYLSVAALACGGLWWYQRRHRRDWETILRKQALVDSATDGIHVFDGDGRLIEANPAFLTMLGLKPEAIGQLQISDIDARFSPADIHESMRRLHETGVPLRLETRLRHRDGHLIEAEITCYSFKERGRTLFVASSRDVSAHKRALERLAQRELELKTIIDTAPECVKLLAEDGSLLDMNPAGLAMIQADSLEQVRGQNVIKLIVPEHRQAFSALRRRVFAGNSGMLEFEIVGLQGRRRWMESHAVPMRDTQGRITALLALTRDITERKAAERELAKLHQAIEQMPGGICITDAAGDIEYVNAAFISGSGYAWDELIGRNPRLLSAGQTPRETYRAMWDTLCAGKVWTGELVNRRKNGEIYIESEIISPICEEGGRTTSYLAIKQDVTEKKRLQNELEAYREHLEELVASKTAELQEANRSLAVSNELATQAARSKAAFLSNMSHEIRTPMNGIIGMLHLLRRSDMDERQLGYLAKIERSAKHLLALVNDILDLSKIDAGKMLLEQLPVNVPAIVANVCSIISESAREKGLAVVTDLAPLPAGLLGDATRLTQLLLNYVSNAVKFTAQGRITIRTRVDQSDSESTVVRFEVEDTGMGVPPEVLGRLFQAFEQADSSTTRLYQGSGLGLAINRQLACLMGGAAGVASTPGQGSRFWFTVRLAQGEPDTAPADADRVKGDAESRILALYAGRRALLVEDEPINQEISQILLADAGFDVDLASNGEEAVARVRAQDYALILMDMQMPLMDGLEATRHIRQLANGKTVPILATTANAFADDRERCLAAGMNDFIAKPVEPELLFRKILDCLGDG